MNALEVLDTKLMRLIHEKSDFCLFLLQPGLESDLFHWHGASDEEVDTFF